jgi:hypothetical protein
MSLITVGYYLVMCVCVAHVIAALYHFRWGRECGSRCTRPTCSGDGYHRCINWACAWVSLSTVQSRYALWKTVLCCGIGAHCECVIVSLASLDLMRYIYESIHSLNVHFRFRPRVALEGCQSEWGEWWGLRFVWNSAIVRFIWYETICPKWFCL